MSQVETAPATPENLKRSERGFGIYAELEDLNQNQVRVSQSSLATEPAVRIYSTNPTGQTTGLHLSVEQATLIRDALTVWLDTETGDAEPEGWYLR